MLALIWQPKGSKSKIVFKKQGNKVSKYRRIKRCIFVPALPPCVSFSPLQLLANGHGRIALPGPRIIQS